MASWMDSLLAGGWLPVAAGGPAQFDEYGNPIPVDAPAPKSPFPEIKKKAAIQSMAPQAGIVEPGLGQMGPLGLLPNGGRTPDPTMPGNDYPAIPTPAIRQMQSLVDPSFEQTAERVPMPRARPAGADTPQVPVREADGAVSNAATDISSSNRGSVRPQVPADGNAPASPAPAVETGGGMPNIFGRIGNFLQNNSNTLLALGAGFAGAPNIGQGISRASAAAIPAAQADIKNRTLLQSQSSTYQALVQAGVPKNQALGAIGNPDLQKALIKSYIEDRGKTIQMVKQKDPWGGETEVPYVVDKFAKEGEPVMRPAFQAGGAQGGGALPAGGAQNPTGTAIYAPGIDMNNFDHSKIGEDYIQQFSPEVQNTVKNYLRTGTIPSGRQGQTAMIKQVAAKYGNDIGMPADDATLVQRKEFARSLGDTKSGVGLQAKGFQQGLEHFVKLSDNLVKMNLSNGLGFEPAAGWHNWVKSLSTDQQELIHKSDVTGQALAREMGNLFSKNGGGVHEAAETKKNISNAFMSSKSAAGALEAVDELMQGGLGALTNRRDELFPNGNAPKGSEFLGPKQQEQLEHIRKNIAILKGEAPAPTASAAPKAPAPGRYRYDPQSGTMTPIQ